MLNKIRYILNRLLSIIFKGCKVNKDSSKIRGKVKWFSKKKGFGFLTSGDKDYFAHFSAVEGDGFKTLNAGAAVLFRPTKGPKGPQAENITIL